MWYETSDPPSGIWWWAVEHKGHPAFYLRAFVPGDFAPGRLPNPRHLRPLLAPEVPLRVVCGTCGNVPRVKDLEVFERVTRMESAALVEYRSGRRPWPRPTDEASCFQCSDRRTRASRPVEVLGRPTKMCPGCEAHVLLRRRGGR